VPAFADELNGKLNLAYPLPHLLPHPIHPLGRSPHDFGIADAGGGVAGGLFQIGHHFRRDTGWFGFCRVHTSILPRSASPSSQPHYHCGFTVTWSMKTGLSPVLLVPW